MPKSRLNLNFSLNSSKDRVNFLNSSEFTMPPHPTQKELSQISDYILWGDKTENSKLLESKWNQNKSLLSYEELISSPSFNENIFNKLNPPTKYKRETFSREQARTQAPPHILQDLEFLWKRIDALELSINLYEIQTGRRAKPPRPELIERTDTTLLSTFDSQKAYLNARHLLIELRQEQYTLRDRYKSTPIIPHNVINVFQNEVPNIITAPFPAYSSLTSQFYITNLKPTEDVQTLTKLYNLLWNPPKDPHSFIFDFSNTTHLAAFVYYFYDLETIALDADVESNLPSLISTFNFYVDFANLSPIYKSILSLKFENYSNIDIARRINQAFGKTYNGNYISTLFHQKILKGIADAVLLHRKILENLFYPENFKRCKDCGHLYLIDPIFFTRRARSADGFTSRCKNCDKERRKSNKK